MCGIIGFSGERPAAPILLDGLAALEYRGYDSAGVALMEKDGIRTIKTEGKVEALRQKLREAGEFGASCGIGHTRWATHGEVCARNAHPHTSGRVTLVHNGIIENSRMLRGRLEAMGKMPVSQTDSEIIAMEIDRFYQGEPEKAIFAALAEMTGSWALCILFSDRPGKIYAIHRGSPLVAAKADGESFVASDITALGCFTDSFLPIPEDLVLELGCDGIRAHDSEGKEVPLCPEPIDWDVVKAHKGGFAHFMLKEIYDQPQALRDTLAPRLSEGIPDFETDGIEDGFFYGCRQVEIVACGTAMHAGLVGAQAIERLAGVPCRVELASEFRYREPLLDGNTLVLLISQSGETADTLAALRLARSSGARTLSIVNVKGSTIARESGHVLYTHAGPEIAVASTKAYTVQLLCLYLIAIRLSLVHGRYSRRAAEELTAQLKEAIAAVPRVLEKSGEFEDAAGMLKEAEDAFFIGRGLDWALAQEGSLKLKEISYIHSEAYAAGELKHGTISLIEEGVPVIALATQPQLAGKMSSNIQEVSARGGKVLLLAGEEAAVEGGKSGRRILLPSVPALFAPIPTAAALQLLAYHTAVLRGCDVDQPRNLAKSVTVE